MNYVFYKPSLSLYLNILTNGALTLFLLKTTIVDTRQVTISVDLRHLTFEEVCDVDKTLARTCRYWQVRGAGCRQRRVMTGRARRGGRRCTERGECERSEWHGLDGKWACSSHLWFRRPQRESVSRRRYRCDRGQLYTGAVHKSCEVWSGPRERSTLAT